MIRILCTTSLSDLNRRATAEDMYAYLTIDQLLLVLRRHIGEIYNVRYNDTFLVSSTAYHQLAVLNPSQI